jgi:hypothetical protein
MRAENGEGGEVLPHLAGAFTLLENVVSSRVYLTKAIIAQCLKTPQ